MLLKPDNKAMNNAYVAKADIAAHSGVIHIIDAALLPE